DFLTAAPTYLHSFSSRSCLPWSRAEPRRDKIITKLRAPRCRRTLLPPSLLLDQEGRDHRRVRHHSSPLVDGHHHDRSSCACYMENNFVATLIEGRDQKKRPTEFGMNQVLQPFHSEKFNFTKVKSEEVIFVSPIGYCHVLLIPQVQECLPQWVDQESFLLAMHVAKEARNPFFRVGYNSDLSQVVSNACIFLQENNKPFIVLISESAKRVFLLLQ
ncbi:hypothetical protein ZWY2020_017841, partial [Hordeum vulgare]